MQGVIHGVIQALVGQVKLPFTLATNQTSFGVEHIFDAMTNPKVCPVHVTSDDEQDSDRQVVMRHICQPKRLSLRMETTQESQDSCTSPLRSSKYLTSSIWILSIHTPVTSKEGHQTRWVRHGGQKVIPAHVLTTGFRNSYVDQVTSPSQGTNPKQTGKVVVETVFSTLEPREARTELGLEV